MSGGKRVTAIGRSSISCERRFCRVVLTARIALYVLIDLLRATGGQHSGASRRTPRTRSGGRERAARPARVVGRRQSRRSRSSLQRQAVVLAGVIARARFAAVPVLLLEPTEPECLREREQAALLLTFHSSRGRRVRSTPAGMAVPVRRNPRLPTASLSFAKPEHDRNRLRRVATLPRQYFRDEPTRTLCSPRAE